MRTADPILTGGRDQRSRPLVAVRPAEPTTGVPQVVVLAAGMGTRLGRKLPKPLTPLMDGRSIMQQQLDGVRAVFGDATPITAVVGYRAKAVMRAQPDLLFAFNPDFAVTNTSQSLLRALRTSQPGGVLWLNGDVVFDPAVLDHAAPLVHADQSFVCVDTSTVADEEVKYTLDEDGYIAALSKTVVGGLGEAVGINYVSGADKAALIEHLAACEASDYFERGMELAIQHAGVQFRPLDISRFSAVEVDFDDDLQRANTWLGSRAALEPLASELG
ncbi:NTP transferase domain-containing protein [Modestobacter italicus]|uniref:phosphocholine cytidylyltransferase family protein n=1 Tax=Modestobacter italicus (strain DSM 44449 / CECT 9708 / BC 501) TaxID=2732864 RepID=UPI001C95C1FA|nr:NTP transferase domain-containing protein [Modestobacter italicus]